MEESYQTYKSRLLSILFFHQGEDHAIDMGELYRRVFLEEYTNKINGTRALRRLITELRKEGNPIGSVSKKNAGGYYMITRPGEMEAFLRKLHEQAIKKLALEAKLRKITLPDLLGQMHMELRSQ